MLPTTIQCARTSCYSMEKHTDNVHSHCILDRTRCAAHLQPEALQTFSSQACRIVTFLYDRPWNLIFASAGDCAILDATRYYCNMLDVHRIYEQNVGGGGIGQKYASHRSFVAYSYVDLLLLQYYNKAHPACPPLSVIALRPRGLHIDHKHGHGDTRAYSAECS